jgi:hypothetical protein
MALLVSSCSMNPPIPADKGMNLLGLGMDEPLASFDKLIPYAENLVKQDLHDVRYRGVVFSGACKTVEQLRGRLTIIFLGTVPALLQPRLIRGIAVIDTIKGVGEIRYSDQTDYYPVTQPDRVPTQAELRKVMRALQAELTTNNSSDCNLVVTQIDPKWHARCGKLDDFVQTCAYEVSADGSITTRSVK